MEPSKKKSIMTDFVSTLRSETKRSLENRNITLPDIIKMSVTDL